MIKLFSITGFLFLFAVFSFGQSEFQAGEFDSPLGIPIILSGTFAELRSNHFHGGLDIKTNGKQGYKVYSAKEGFISRIKVQPGGYGHALYVEHPNGYTTVYGHLKRFNDQIAAYVKQQQYNNQSFYVDLYLTPGQFQVQKGEIIGFSGNSGSSGGPHLHYEIRKTGGQVPINPLLYTKVRDDIKPTIYGVRVHELVNSIYHAESYTQPANYISSGVYNLKDTVRVNHPVIGASIKAIDKLNGANNSNGYVSLKMMVDGHLTYEYAKEAMPFDKNRYLNAHIDYPEKKVGGGTYVHCFKLPGNQLSIYDPVASDGRIWLSQYPVRNVAISVCDFAGNESTVEFVVKYEESQQQQPTFSGEYMRHNQYNFFNREDVSVEIPNGSLYDDIYLSYEKNETTIPKYPIYSSLHQIHNETVPLHKLMTVSVKETKLPVELRSKALLANLDRKGRINVNTGTWQGDMLQAKTRQFGQFFITTDTQKPRIADHNAPSGYNYAARTHMQFKISDNLSGIKSYTGTVDGQWILMQYDPKRNLLYHEFDERVTKGKHTFRLTVADAVNNITTKEFEFVR